MEPQAWEQHTMAMLQEAQEELERARQRVTTAQVAVERAAEKVGHIQATLDFFRAKHGLPASEIASASLAAEYKGITSPSQMVRRWVDTHNGKVIMKDFCKAMVAAGMFKDIRLATGSLYSAAKRTRTLRKVSPGVFERRDATPNPNPNGNKVELASLAGLTQ